jgi:hypothetical protein
LGVRIEVGPGLVSISPAITRRRDKMKENLVGWGLRGEKE